MLAGVVPPGQHTTPWVDRDIGGGIVEIDDEPCLACTEPYLPSDRVVIEPDLHLDRGVPCVLALGQNDFEAPILPTPSGADLGDPRAVYPTIEQPSEVLPAGILEGSTQISTLDEVMGVAAHIVPDARVVDGISEVRA